MAGDKPNAHSVGQAGPAKAKGAVHMSEANRSSNVPLNVYEEILSAPKSSDQEATDLWDGVLALYQAKDTAKKAKENSRE